jgi:uncharacterized protein
MPSLILSRRALLALPLAAGAFLPGTGQATGVAEAAVRPGPPLTGARARQSWSQLRSAGLVRQERDFSCGPAALATILTYYYGRPTSEAEILALTGAQDETTFSQLADASQTLGYPATGATVTLELLRTLQVPVIGFLMYRGTGHFTVIRGIGRTGRVQLADPSWGNRTLQPARFSRLFDPDRRGSGRILIIQPAGTHRDTAWFTRPAPLEIHRADLIRTPRIR